ncbi:hypothetical protein A3B85_02480 [Candidatus Nomurabacteria bacterium RIFCSPHIGHO2_02_FULL_37_13]|uniref:Uncharacterized protein n=1 Tax=Candidatus Nomurabacteria bacterium RIFCSPHIGHO2_02_FULL_37_13 TaxID=1801750 RepID=A0A1F6W505_9BACT|nr:MAG: hypothetical protein A2640_00320 [Candidatus Nomurabacteria bacterium RIFCSPHIGHO2_01_FULL_36_23]OGI76765.1 MAG: hypothetical protein A3B85_02480 [Candidatus Nomurabacteria bacterium RIFCSPHIGHO2_02_FULL_37_13]OGI88494.1 MAG: hypothetical protein A2906_00080 [Candidatus Nomurabacteria bacterium RIFCSPLOWO2_01_FULL_37_25]
MKKIIHHLRKQPEQVRRHILHISIIIAGIIMLSLWVYSLGENFSNADTQKKLEQNLKPFSILKDNMAPLW